MRVNIQSCCDRLAIYCVAALVLCGHGAVVAGPVVAEKAPLQVLTTIKPLQLIATAVLGGAQPVGVLLDSRMSPHDYQLRPSDRSKLDRADVVFWVGPTLETFLVPIWPSLPKRIKVVSLQTELAVAGDPHIWMDPLVAAAVARKMADTLGELAPTYSQVWHANAARLEDKLIVEDRRLRQQIAAIKSPRGYIVAHDAYGRLEARYGLEHRAALTDAADLPPSASQLARIEALLNSGEVSCAIQEPNTPSKLLRTLLQARQVKLVTMDPLAVEVPLDEDGIVEFYRRLGAAMVACLQP